MENNNQDNKKIIDSELNKNYKFLFEKPEEESKEISKHVDEMQRSLFSRSQLKEELRKKYGNEFFEYTYLDTLINYLTAKDSMYDKMMILEEMESLDIVKDIYMINDSEYSVITDKGTISFTTIDAFLENNKEKCKYDTDLAKKYIDKYEEEVTTMSGRANSCHVLSINIAKILQMYYDIPSDVVTGYPSYYVDENRYLHSWNELEIDGVKQVIDSTMNTLMNKEGYYLIRNIKENENISKVSAIDLLRDDRQYRKLLDDLDLKTYLTCRDEIIKDLEKNKNLFQRTDEGEER